MCLNSKFINDGNSKIVVTKIDFLKLVNFCKIHLFKKLLENSEKTIENFTSRFLYILVFNKLSLLFKKNCFFEKFQLTIRNFCYRKFIFEFLLDNNE